MRDSIPTPPTTADKPDVAAIAARLSERARQVLVHQRFNPKGWEPANPNSRAIVEMIDEGLLRRADGRCGFERFKDSHVVPTPLGLLVRQHLMEKNDVKG
ncbi:hypothetical protein GG804_26430 [Sphingomonas histidinilytica]|uniref:hypothetical protein n=1 Tax=Rhizorhabdus histidinilytica TaxID=439228 RepID=UPI001ADAA2C6|nr:hypothetical protein [Rhizorhabdus histidinilytica]MBO9380307.1 hypothetical protein [Rhizorhabdus histidinilytica]